MAENEYDNLLAKVALFCQGRNTYTPGTQRFTRLQNPPSSAPLEPTEDTRNYFQLASSTSVYNNYSVGDGRPEKWCEEKRARNLLWPKTPPGQTVLMYCPNNQAGQIFFFQLLSFLLSSR